MIAVRFPLKKKMLGQVKYVNEYVVTKVPANFNEQLP